MVFFCFSDKDRELGEAHAEIRALRLSERQREKAVEEVFLVINHHHLLFFFFSSKLTLFHVLFFVGFLAY